MLLYLIEQLVKLLLRRDFGFSSFQRKVRESLFHRPSRTLTDRLDGFERSQPSLICGVRPKNSSRLGLLHTESTDSDRDDLPVPVTLLISACELVWRCDEVSTVGYSVNRRLPLYISRVAVHGHLYVSSINGLKRKVGILQKLKTHALRRSPSPITLEREVVSKYLI